MPHETIESARQALFNQSYGPDKTDTVSLFDGYRVIEAHRIGPHEWDLYHQGPGWDGHLKREVDAEGDDAPTWVMDTFTGHQSFHERFATLDAALKSLGLESQSEENTHE